MLITTETSMKRNRINPIAYKVNLHVSVCVLKKNAGEMIKRILINMAIKNGLPRMLPNGLVALRNNAKNERAENVYNINSRESVSLWPVKKHTSIQDKPNTQKAP